jgi:hypothetical protein
MYAVTAGGPPWLRPSSASTLQRSCWATVRRCRSQLEKTNIAWFVHGKGRTGVRKALALLLLPRRPAPRRVPRARRAGAGRCLLCWGLKKSDDQALKTRSGAAMHVEVSSVWFLQSPRSCAGTADKRQPATMAVAVAVAVAVALTEEGVCLRTKGNI